MSLVVLLWFFSLLFLSVAGFGVFSWACSDCICLERANISSYAWVRLCESVKLMLVMFANASFSSTFAFSRACSEYAVIIWVSISRAWFAAAPYPWAAAVDFLWI